MKPPKLFKKTSSSKHAKGDKGDNVPMEDFLELQVALQGLKDECEDAVENLELARITSRTLQEQVQDEQNARKELVNELASQEAELSEVANLRSECDQLREAERFLQLTSENLQNENGGLFSRIKGMEVEIESETARADAKKCEIDQLLKGEHEMSAVRSGNALRVQETDRLKTKCATLEEQVANEKVEHLVSMKDVDASWREEVQRYRFELQTEVEEARRLASAEVTSREICDGRQEFTPTKGKGPLLESTPGARSRVESFNSAGGTEDSLRSAAFGIGAGCEAPSFEAVPPSPREIQFDTQEMAALKQELESLREEVSVMRVAGTESLNQATHYNDEWAAAAEVTRSLETTVELLKLEKSKAKAAETSSHAEASRAEAALAQEHSSHLDALAAAKAAEIRAHADASRAESALAQDLAAAKTAEASAHAEASRAEAALEQEQSSHAEDLTAAKAAETHARAEASRVESAPAQDQSGPVEAVATAKELTVLNEELECWKEEVSDMRAAGIKNQNHAESHEIQFAAAAEAKRTLEASVDRLKTEVSEAKAAEACAKAEASLAEFALERNRSSRVEELETAKESREIERSRDDAMERKFEFERKGLTNASIAEAFLVASCFRNWHNYVFKPFFKEKEIKAGQLRIQAVSRSEEEAEQAFLVSWCLRQWHGCIAPPEFKQREVEADRMRIRLYSRCGAEAEQVFSLMHCFREWHGEVRLRHPESGRRELEEEVAVHVQRHACMSLAENRAKQALQDEQVAFDQRIWTLDKERSQLADELDSAEFALQVTSEAAAELGDDVEPVGLREAKQLRQECSMLENELRASPQSQQTTPRSFGASPAMAIAPSEGCDTPESRPPFDPHPRTPSFDGFSAKRMPSTTPSFGADNSEEITQLRAIIATQETEHAQIVENVRVVERELFAERSLAKEFHRQGDLARPQTTPSFSNDDMSEEIQLRATIATQEAEHAQAVETTRVVESELLAERSLAEGLQRQVHAAADVSVAKSDGKEVVEELRQLLEEESAKSRRLGEHALRAEQSRRRLLLELAQDEEAEADMAALARVLGRAAKSIATINQEAPVGLSEEMLHAGVIPAAVSRRPSGTASERRIPRLPPPTPQPDEVRSPNPALMDLT